MVDVIAWGKRSSRPVPSLLVGGGFRLDFSLVFSLDFSPSRLFFLFLLVGLFTLRPDPPSAVRMGSRVSVIEKRLDETKEHLMLVGRLSDRSGAHTAQIHNLSETVTKLCKLLGVEERFQATMQTTQVFLCSHYRTLQGIRLLGNCCGPARILGTTGCMTMPRKLLKMHARRAKTSWNWFHIRKTNARNLEAIS